MAALLVQLLHCWLQHVYSADSTVFIARQHTNARYWYSKSVRPSVRNVPVSDENGLTYGHSFPLYGSPIILVLSASKPSRNSDGVTPCGGAKYRWGIKISRFSTNKSYLANDTRYRYSYYGRRIGTSMRSIKWCHFQWPWTNPNPVSKVTPLFDAKYLINGYRYGHSYYRRQIWNRTQAFEWHQFQWPWVFWPVTPISRSRYYSTSNNSQAVQDRAIVTTVD